MTDLEIIKLIKMDDPRGLSTESCHADAPGNEKAQH